MWGRDRRKQRKEREGIRVERYIVTTNWSPWQGLKFQCLLVKVAIADWIICQVLREITSQWWRRPMKREVWWVCIHQDSGGNAQVPPLWWGVSHWMLWIMRHLNDAMTLQESLTPAKMLQLPVTSPAGELWHQSSLEWGQRQYLPHKVCPVLISFNTQLQPVGLCSASPPGRVLCTLAAPPHQCLHQCLTFRVKIRNNCMRQVFTHYESVCRLIKIVGM